VRPSTANYNGYCATIQRVEEGGTVLDAPYACDPIAGPGCSYRLTRNGGYAALATGQCSCSLSGNTGYCKVPGDKEFREYGQAIKFMASKSSFCHTWDRHNIIANPECTIAAYEDIRESYELIYEFKNWPYIQASSQAKECFDNFHPESQYNLRFSERAGDALIYTSIWFGLISLFLTLV